MISQSDLLTVAAWRQFHDPDMEKDFRKCLRRIRTDFLDKICGLEAANISDIIFTLVEILNELPVVSDSQETTPAQFYSVVMDILKEAGICLPLRRYTGGGGGDSAPASSGEGNGG